MLYMHTNMEEAQLYFDKFDKTYWKSREQPTIKLGNLVNNLQLSNWITCASLESKVAQAS
jgi:hypothetical protein